jgi:hypothetical protein
MSALNELETWRQQENNAVINQMISLEAMRVAVRDGDTKILTIERAKDLTGKRIGTIYFNFTPMHLPEVDEFVIGEMKSEYDLHSDKKSVHKEFRDKPHLIRKMKNTYEIITDEGRRTNLRASSYNSGIFTGPDKDYEVWFKVV